MRRMGYGKLWIANIEQEGSNFERSMIWRQWTTNLANETNFFPPVDSPAAGHSPRFHSLALAATISQWQERSSGRAISVHLPSPSLRPPGCHSASYVAPLHCGPFLRFRYRLDGPLRNEFGNSFYIYGFGSGQTDCRSFAKFEKFAVRKNPVDEWSVTCSRSRRVRRPRPTSVQN